MVFRHVDDDLGFALVRDRDDRLPFRDDLPDLEPHGGHGAAARCAQDRVLHLIASEIQFARLGLGRCPGGEQLAVCVLLVGVAYRPVELQILQTPPVRIGLAHPRHSSLEMLAGGFLRQLEVDVIQHREHVAFAYRVADVDPPLHDLAADAKRLIDLVSRLHRAEVTIRVARRVVAKFDRANGPKRPRLRCARSARGKQRGSGYGDGDRGKQAFQDGSPLSGAGLERFPASPERLEELHGGEQQLCAAVVCVDPDVEARALRIEQRQEVDLTAVVE